MTSALTASGLEFWYGTLRRVPVLASLDWTVPQSKTLLLGPNGAGKSTLLGLLAGFLKPKAGQVSYGVRSGRRELFRAVSWMPQHIAAARGLTVTEQVEYSGWLGGMTSRDARASTRRVLAMTDLEEKSGVRASALSGGQLRRLGLAQVLVRDVEVLLLDEPTAGLDPAQASNFRSILARIDPPGGLVVSTHQISDLAGDLDWVTVVADGEVKFDDSMSAFRASGSAPGSGEAGDDLASIFASLVGGSNH